MTNNHLLLYRLAELMLQKQHHVLPVDLLFDDEQIGDFVKSIQIDSPYQQMLLEGVLTESVRDEKLYLSFTVEGYFHYVLGEVIKVQAEGKGVDFFKRQIELEKFQGLIEGIENCLIKDIEQGNSSRIIDLIDDGGEILEACVTPLANHFLAVKRKTTIGTPNEVIQKHVEAVLEELFTEPSDYDIIVLEKVIEKLESAQKNEICSLIFQKINKIVEPNTINRAIIYLKTFEYFPNLLDEKDLSKILELNSNIKSQDRALLCFMIGKLLSGASYYEESNIYLRISIKIFSKKRDNDIFRAKSYYELALNMIWQDDYRKAFLYLQNSYDIYIKHLGEENIYIGEIYCAKSIIYNQKNDTINAIGFLNKSFKIHKKIYGKYHPETAIIYHNIADILVDAEYRVGTAKKFMEKGLEICLTISNNHSNLGRFYNGLGKIYASLGDYINSISNYKNAITIAQNNFGLKHPDTARALYNLGISLIDSEEYGKAYEYCNQSYYIFLEKFGKNHSYTISNYKTLGLIYNEKGKMEREKGELKTALKTLINSLKIRLEILGDNNPQTAETFFNIGSVFEDLKKKKIAKRYYFNSINIFTNVLGREHELTKYIQNKINDL